MLATLPRPGSGLQTLPETGSALPCVPVGGPDPAVFAGAVARYRVLDRLRGFRQSLYECLDARADALSGLADTVLCADHAVTSLVQLCLEPEFTRGHGALYDALSAGRISEEKLFSLLAAELPQAVDGPEARGWIAEHDMMDRGLLDKALAGLPAEDAAQVRDACARWARMRVPRRTGRCVRPANQPRSPWMRGCTPCQASARTVPYSGVSGRVRVSPGSGFGGKGFFRPRGPCPAPAVNSAGSRQCTAGPRRAGRPYLPSQVTGSA